MLNPKPHGTLMVVVLAFNWNYREPRSISAVVIDHVVGSNPQELVALVNVQLGQCRLIPPELVASILATLDNIIRCDCDWALTGIDVEPSVGCYEGRMAPISLHPATLSGPVVRIPYRAVNSHGLIFWKWQPMFLHVGVHTYWRSIHKKPEHRHMEILNMNEWWIWH